MLSSAIIASSVLAQAALGVRIFSTADVGSQNNVAADLAVHADAALAQIEAVSEPKEFDSDAQVARAKKFATTPSRKRPNLNLDLEEMGGGYSDTFQEGFEERQRVRKDLEGNIIGRSGSGSKSGSWNAEGSGSYENSRGSGSWDFSASMSYSVSFNHSWRAKSDDPKSPVNPEKPVEPSPEPIAVNPCDCCDCGDGTFKVPQLFNGKSSPVTKLPIQAAQTDSCAAVTCNCEALAEVCGAWE